MELLPDLVSIEDALGYWRDMQPAHESIAAHVAGYLSMKKIGNKESRELLGISKVYEMTHLRRIGTLLSRTCLELWLNNPHRIGIGHMRAITSMPKSQQEEKLRSILTRRVSVRDLESIARGDEIVIDHEIKLFQERMGEAIGYPVGVKWLKESGKGTISIKFFSLNDLDELARRLGYDTNDGL
tara:strand:- start:26899 stop:27450 length:552 start_codon:yes stop_codon:yes gene_type:complete